MEAVGVALRTYLDAHEGTGVPTLDLLANHELITEQQLRCPSSPRDEIGYILVEPDDPQDPVWADGMLYEQPYNHRNQGGNVLFADISEDSWFFRLIQPLHFNRQAGISIPVIGGKNPIGKCGEYSGETRI